MSAASSPDGLPVACEVCPLPQAPTAHDGFWLMPGRRSRRAYSQRRSLRPWAIFAHHSRLERIIAALALVAAAAQGACAPLFSIFFGDSIQSMVAQRGGGALDAIKPVALKMLALCGVDFALSALWHASISLVAERAGARLRANYLQALLEKDASWFDMRSAAELPSRMASDTQNVQDASGTHAGSLVAHFAKFLVGIGVAMNRGWELTLVLLITMPLFVFMGSLTGRATVRAMRSNAERYAVAAAVAEQALQMIRTVVAFGGEDREVERYRERLSPSIAGGVYAGFLLGLAKGLFACMMHALFSIAYAYAAFFLVGTRMNPATDMVYSGSDIMTVLVAMNMSLSVFWSVPEDLHKLLPGLVSLEAVQWLMDEPSAIERKAAERDDKSFVLPGSRVSAWGSDKMRVNGKCVQELSISEIAFTDVYFSYPSRRESPVLRGISLTIYGNQKAAFVGESGSGKSTVMQLLLRFYDADSGQILINRTPIEALALRSFRRQMGYVGQEPVLFAASLRANIQGGDQLMSDLQVLDAAEQAQLGAVINALPKGLDTFVGSQGCHFSGGQKQRIAIARAMARRPQVLLLDEATSALDNESELQVQTTIDQLQQASRSLTTIAIAHRLSTVRNSDVIFFLCGGVVIERGSHSELMSSQGAYFRSVMAQECGQSFTASRCIHIPSGDLVGVTQLSQMAPVTSTSSWRLAGESLSDCVSLLSERRSDASDNKRLQDLDASNFRIPYRRIFGMMSFQERGVLAVLGLLVLVTSACMPIWGYMLGVSTAAFYLTPASAMQAEILKWVSLMVGNGVSQVILLPPRQAASHFLVQKTVMRLRVAAFRNLLRQHIGFFDDPDSGAAGICSTLEVQAQTASNMFLSLAGIISCFWSIAFTLIIASVVCWQLTLSLAIIIPGLLGLNGCLLRASRISKEASDMTSQAVEISTEAIVNIRTVHALVMEVKVQSIYWARVSKAASRAIPKFVVAGLVFAVGNLNTLLIVFASIVLGAAFMQSDGVTFEMVFQVLLTLACGSTSAGNQFRSAQDMQSERIAMCDLFTKIDLKSEILASSLGEEPELSALDIEFRNVRFGYPHRHGSHVFTGVSFLVRAGQSMALVGPSGCGKSTAIQLLLRFYSPSQGCILVGGVPLNNLSVSWWRRHVGIVSQEPVLFDASLEENVRYGKPDATPAELEAAARDANLDFVLNGIVRWTDSVGASGGKLSGGQKQRCAIARALVRSPKLLLLDEATSALDAVAEHDVQAALQTARKGRTTITIAHRLSTIADSDLIVVLEAGVVAEQGAHQELLDRRGLYWKLWRR